ncbi:MAG: DNA-binding response regulator [Segetibacter sp.]|nr:DNA-binding response regulator [Segetibacter sp.]
MKCLIIDDNKMARTAMRQLVSQVEDLAIAGECSNAMEAYNFMQSQPVDVLFLDIEMPDMTGLELTRHFGNKKPIIIFTTSKKEYAVDAFELNVADYIVKPVTTPRFLQAVEKVREIYNSHKLEVSIEEKEFVFIRDNGILKRLLIDDIHFLEAMGDYVKVFTQQKFHAIHTTLKTVEEKLPPNKFLRVHRSYIVALNKIDKIEEGVIVINNKPVPVADAYRSTLNQRLNIL